MDFSAKAVVQDLTALLLAQIGGAEQPKKIGLCLKAFIQDLYLYFYFVSQIFT